jgi:hypothetical protein
MAAKCLLFRGELESRPVTCRSIGTPGHACLLCNVATGVLAPLPLTSKHTRCCCALLSCRGLQAGGADSREARYGGGYEWQPSDDATFFPGRQARVYAKGQEVGIFGIVHPEVRCRPPPAPHAPPHLPASCSPVPACLRTTGSVTPCLPALLPTHATCNGCRLRLWGVVGCRCCRRSTSPTRYRHWSSTWSPSPSTSSTRCSCERGDRDLHLTGSGSLPPHAAPAVHSVGSRHSKLAQWRGQVNASAAAGNLGK